jgi:hypothetical protein
VWHSHGLPSRIRAIHPFGTEPIVMNPSPVNEFEKHAVELADSSIFGEFWLFLCHTKKWWLLPILGVILLLGMLVLMSGSAATPFIYTLF